MLTLHTEAPPKDAPYTIECFDSERSWLAARREGVGGSDIPVILGLARWSSPFELWCEKTGKIQPEPSGLFFDVRRRLEDLVATHTLAAYPDLDEAELDGSFAILRSKSMPWRQYSPDDVLIPKGQTLEHLEPAAVRLAEFKTVDPRARDDWDAEPAKTASTQLQWGLSITGWPQGIIAALIGLGDEFLHYTQAAHPELQSVILARAEAFWHCVVTDTPPETDYTEATRRALAALYPKDTGETIQLDPARFGPVLSAWRVAKAEAKAVAERENAAKNALAAAIGSATRAEIPGFGALTYKTTNRAGYVVEATSYRTLREVK